MKLPNEFDSSLYTAKLRRMGREESMSTDEQVKAMDAAPAVLPNKEAALDLDAAMHPPRRRSA